MEWTPADVRPGAEHGQGDVRPRAPTPRCCVPLCSTLETAGTGGTVGAYVARERLPRSPLAESRRYDLTLSRHNGRGAGHTARKAINQCKQPTKCKRSD